jgi:hypothetical protein
MARSAPASREINEEWNVTNFSMFGKPRRIVESNRRTFEQGLMTLAAFAALPKTVARQPINGVAVRANGEQLVHWTFPCSFLARFIDGHQRTRKICSRRDE